MLLKGQFKRKQARGSYTVALHQSGVSPCSEILSSGIPPAIPELPAGQMWSWMPGPEEEHGTHGEAAGLKGQLQLSTILQVVCGARPKPAGCIIAGIQVYNTFFLFKQSMS